MAVLVGEHINENGQENHSGMTVTATIWGKTGKSYESFHPILSPGAIAIAGRGDGNCCGVVKAGRYNIYVILKECGGKRASRLDFVHRF
ncbi:MAG: hypothetical protein ACLR8P_03950 [Clostridium fessum]